jgi:large subunit ribosomal protein L6
MKIPEGISVELKQGAVKVQGKLGTVERKYDARFMNVEKKGEEIAITAKGKTTRKMNAALGTLEAHLGNAFEGVTKGFEKHLAVVFAHFPITVEVKGREALVKNFLGEKIPRKADIIGATKVEAKGQDVFVRGSDSDDVGQTAANLVASTKVREKDVRRFQDGIYYAPE